MNRNCAHSKSLWLCVLLIGHLTSLYEVHAQAEYRWPDPQALEGRIDSLLQHLYDPSEPGAAVIVTAGSQVLFRGAYGMSNLELNIPLSPETTFCLASLTKPITATAVMMLEEAGKIDLDHPLARYLPAFPAGENVLLKHLLSHTSGIVDFLRNGSISESSHKEYTPDELIALIEDEPLEFAPGTQVVYSNSNYLLLARIIEVVTGMSWEDYLRTEIFGPAGMLSTGYGGHHRVIPMRAFGYEIAPDSTSWRHEDPISWTIGFGLGGLFSSVNDLARWNEALDTGRLIGTPTLERMFTPSVLASGEASWYGYGWGVSRISGRRAVRHTGDIAGYRTHMLKFPDDGVFIAVLSNRWEREPSPAKIAEEIAAFAFEGRDQCPLTESDTRWIQGFLDDWTRASREFLQIDPDPLPQIVLFDASCEWYLGNDVGDAPGSEKVDTPLRFIGKPVPVQSRSHDGNVQLPNGSRVPAGIIAVAMPGPADRDAFLVLALPEVWRRHPGASQDPHVAIRVPSVALHELIHTHQLPDLRRHVRALGERFDLPAGFDDDVVEARFGDSPEYGTMFDLERDLLYDAVAEPDVIRSISLASKALSMAQSRRERFFVDGDEMYAELEGLFLNMEGLAEWVRFKSHQADHAWPNDDADIIDFLRGRDNSWSQDEGLALMLLLDRIMPDWKRKILDPTMPSPMDLLREVIHDLKERR